MELCPPGSVPLSTAPNALQSARGSGGTLLTCFISKRAATGLTFHKLSRSLFVPKAFLVNSTSL